MPSIFSCAALALAVSSAVAAPAAVDKRATCTFSGTTGAALVKANKKSCSTITLSNVVVPAGATLDLTGLNANTAVVFEGTTTFGYSEWPGPLVSVSGSGIQVTGASGSVIDAQGGRWWDGQGSNGGKTKPKFFYAHSLTGNSKISSITIKDSPVQVFSINTSSDLTLDHITVNNKNGDTNGGHNTDAFDIGSSSNIHITNPTVYNQDDCLAINSGTGITFSGAYCSGGHGISIGSVGGRDDNTVKTVTITNSQIVNSDNGVRVKTVSGATGSVSGVTYSGITLSNIAKYGIVIEQDYKNGKPTGQPTPNVPITGLTISKVTGTVASGATEVYILCAKGACSGWTWSGVSITGGKKSSACAGIPSGASC